MLKFNPKITTLLLLTFLTTLGLAISLQGVFGIGIGSNLDFGGIRRIIGLPTPTGAGDAATWDFVNTVASGKQNTIIGSCPIGQIIRVVNGNGTVACQ